MTATESAAGAPAERPSAETEQHRLPGLDESEQRCWQEFLEASARLLQTLHRRLADGHQLALIDFLVLEMLAQASGGSARMGQLAHELVLRPSRVTQQIRRLESQGLVQRRRSGNDGRGVIAVITPEGRARVGSAATTYAHAIRELYLSHVSRAQMLVLGDSCRRIGMALRAPPKPNYPEQAGRPELSARHMEVGQRGTAQFQVLPAADQLQHGDA